jgi:hypothetical protein
MFLCENFNLADNPVYYRRTVRFEQSESKFLVLFADVNPNSSNATKFKINDESMVSNNQFVEDLAIKRYLELENFETSCMEYGTCMKCIKMSLLIKVKSMKVKYVSCLKPH